MKTNDDIINNKQCPAIILANNRIDKLKVLIKYDTTSIIIIKGNKGLGAPCGTNNKKKFNLFFKTPIKKKPKLKLKAKKKVILKCAVIVKLKGNKPKKLQHNIKIKILKKNGKYSIPLPCVC